MQVSLQLYLIIILSKQTIARIFASYEACLHFEIDNLRIPDDNPLIKAEKINDTDDWYTHVNWLDTPAGDLTLSYEVQYWIDGDWYAKTGDVVDIYEKGRKEKFDWARVARKALGLNHPHARIPGKLRVSPNLFSEKCWTGNFANSYDSSYKYFVDLNVTDDDERVFLTGRLIIPRQ